MGFKLTALVIVFKSIIFGVLFAVGLSLLFSYVLAYFLGSCVGFGLWYFRSRIKFLQ